MNLLLVGLSCHKSSHQTIKTFCCSTLADAGENRGEQRTAAADAQNDPGDHVVNVHEVTGLVLEEASISSQTGFPSGGFLGIHSFGDDVTGGVLSSVAESPDHAGDPPGEATTTHTASENARNCGSE